MSGETLINNTDGTCRRAIRNDAVKIQHPFPRWYVPTTEQTKWVSSWAEFEAAGGHVMHDEDQTSIELLLPEGYKFSIQFMDNMRKDG